jgi:hypothetical protein
VLWKSRISYRLNLALRLLRNVIPGIYFQQNPPLTALLKQYTGGLSGNYPAHFGRLSVLPF